MLCGRCWQDWIAPLKKERKLTNSPNRKSLFRMRTSSSLSLSLSRSHARALARSAQMQVKELEAKEARRRRLKREEAAAAEEGGPPLSIEDKAGAGGDGAERAEPSPSSEGRPTQEPMEYWQPGGAQK